MIVVFRHEASECLGHLSPRLEQGNISCEYIDLGHLPSVPPSTKHVTGVIVTGGPQSANDPELHSELEWIRSALRQGIPVLGICLGAQLMAKALGARIYKNAEWEIGWAPIHLTPAAKDDPVFDGIPSPTTCFHWHGETFDLPSGAELLAYSDKCRHQAFRYGRNAYGVQFHPEVTPEMIVDWSSHANSGHGDGDVVTSLASAIDPAAFDTSEIAGQLLNGWLGTFPS